MSPDAAPTPIEREVRRLIAAEGPIPFRQFMELCLYEPEDGYYTRPGATTGTAGDFSTSPDASPDFGRRLAVQAAEVHERLGGGPWRLVELGPGRGLLAQDLLGGLARHAPGALAALREVVLVETSPSLAAEQRRRLESAGHAIAVRWLRSLDELEPHSVEGFVVANELLDALPVHRVERRGGALHETHVGCGADGRLHLVPVLPKDPRLEATARRYGLCRREGDVAEICLALEPLLGALARALARGAVLFIDYGHPAARLGDEEHAGGTLLGYHRHRVVEDLLARPGEQDLTAHVNWDHLVDTARAKGFELAGRVRQDLFLLALGIVDDLVAPGGGPGDDPAAVAARLAARALILPGAGGGQRFEVVGLVKEIGTDLRGFGDPFAALR